MRTTGISVAAVALLALLAGQGPADSQTTDAALRATLLMRLQEEGFDRVDVTADNGSVTLHGQTDNLAEKLRAEEVVHAVSGVSEVGNEIVISGLGLSDEEVARRVGHLMQTIGLDMRFDWVEARVHQGVVTLTGWMVDADNLQVIFDRLARMQGVQDLQPSVVLLDPAGEDDRIRRQAHRLIYSDRAFRRWARENNPPVHLLVSEGRLVLRGEVANEAERSKAEALARRSDAVKVVNLLTIASGAD